EILPPLASGAAIVLHPDPRGETPSDFLTRCARYDVTVAHLPVGFLNELAVDLDSTAREIPASLRLLITGGEAPSRDKIRAIQRAACGELVVWNAYGPTETTVLATNHEVSRHAPRDPVPIGRPLANTS